MWKRNSSKLDWLWLEWDSLSTRMQPSCNAYSCVDAYFSLVDSCTSSADLKASNAQNGVVDRQRVRQPGWQAVDGWRAATFVHSSQPNWESNGQIVAVKERVPHCNDRLKSSEMTDWFQTILPNCQEPPPLLAPLCQWELCQLLHPLHLSGRASTRLCLVCLTSFSFSRFAHSSASSLAIPPSRPQPWIAPFCPNTPAYIAACHWPSLWKELVDKGAGVKRFPVSRRWARSTRSAGVGFLGTEKWDELHCARISRHSSSHNHTQKYTPLAAENSLVYCLPACLPVSGTSLGLGGQPRHNLMVHLYRIQHPRLDSNCLNCRLPTLLNFTHCGMPEGWSRRHAGSGRMHLSVDWWRPWSNVNTAPDNVWRQCGSLQGTGRVWEKQF